MLLQSSTCAYRTSVSQIHLLGGTNANYHPSMRRQAFRAGRWLLGCLVLAAFAALACADEAATPGPPLDPALGGSAGTAAGQACPLGKALCAGVCVDTNTDARHCGTCDSACDADFGLCQAGVCGCSAGLFACEANECVNLLTDPNNCGSCSQACSAGQACAQGECTCALGHLECESACVDPLSDAANCGGCGMACAPTELCEQGACACPQGQTPCSDACVDTMADTANCGGCGMACLERQLCTDGACACPETETECGDACVDTAIDAANCGVCENACPQDHVCTDGECVCPEGQSLCDGSCIDTLADDDNCGACGNACGLGQGCSMGECSGGALGDDGCEGIALNIDLDEIAVYQTVKIPVMSGGAEVDVGERVSDVVAGRDTLVRAFVSPGPGWTPRTLSARLFLQHSDSEVEVVYANSTLMVAGDSEEEQRDSTFEFTLEGEQVRAETGYAVELVECETGSGEASNPRFPLEGGQSLGARETGDVVVHIIPLRSNGFEPDTSEEGLRPYRDGFLAAYPIDDIEFTVSETYDVTNPDDWNGMLNGAATLRYYDNPDPKVYYYAMLKPAQNFQQYCGFGCIAGVGLVPEGQFGREQGRVAVGLAFGDDASVRTMLHEVGHNHGRFHAPCSPNGQIEGVDRSYPYPDASVGVYGYDSRTDLLITPQNTDMMGYCDDQWFSDYTYNGLLDEVVSLNQQMFSVAPPAERIGAWQVLLVDVAFGARWGLPIAGPALAPGLPETADVFDVAGNLVERITVYRTKVSEIDGSSIYVPEAQPGWHAIAVAGAPPVVMQHAP